MMDSMDYKKHPILKNDSFSNENPDFIKVPEVALDFDEIAEFRRKFASIKEHLPFLQESFPKDIDMWITPVLLLEKPMDFVN